MENANPLLATWLYNHPSESSIQFSHSDKFFSKLLEKESDECINTNRNPSFRMYYGGSKSSVPFFWETAPGRPKHAMSLEKDSAASVDVPPLSPPPSYISYGSGNDSVKKGPRKVLEGFLQRIRSTKKDMLHFKYLCASQRSNALGRKAPRHLRNWRPMSLERFCTHFGNSQEGILNKWTSFGGCFNS